MNNQYPNNYDDRNEMNVKPVRRTYAEWEAMQPPEPERLTKEEYEHDKARSQAGLWGCGCPRCTNPLGYR